MEYKKGTPVIYIGCTHKITYMTHVGCVKYIRYME